ncbi:hypothetical protein DFH28DRAFT_836426, partial [Melampsora americana]
KHIVGGGWAKETMKVYNSSIKKYLKSNEKEDRQRGECLPASTNQIYDFALWLSEQKNPEDTSKEAVKAETTRKYVAGLKAWHRLH